MFALPKALRPGAERGACILIGAKAPIIQGAMLSSVLVPFMKLETDEDYDKLKDNYTALLAKQMERAGVHVVYGLAFTTLFFRNYYVSIPDALVKAARLDGAGFFTIFRRIILPMSTPIIMVCLIWQFTQIWNDFLFGVVFSAGGSQPITVALNNLAFLIANTPNGDLEQALTADRSASPCGRLRRRRAPWP